MPSVVDRENLVRKIHFPRIVIPLAVVLTACLNFCLNFVAVLVFFAHPGVELRVVAGSSSCRSSRCSCALCIGLAMLLSALYVRYRDVQPIWDVAHADLVLRHADPLPARGGAGRTGREPHHVQPARGRSCSRCATR